MYGFGVNGTRASELLVNLTLAHLADSLLACARNGRT
jgi:hypothetical protein